MKLLIMGTGPFAVPTFKRLVLSDHDVVALITRPDHQRKGRKTAVNPMRIAAAELGVVVHEPEDINSAEAGALLRELAAELFVVCDYGQILSSDALSLASLGGVNLHGSLLPKYRGAAPVNWAMVNGEKETGVSVIHMTPRLDAGPVLASRSLSIDPEENAAELEHRLSLLGVEPVLDSIEMLAGWDRHSVIGEPQDPALASRARRLKKSDGEIDWTLDTEMIARRVRAFQPWPGAYTWLRKEGGEPLRLLLDRVGSVEEAQRTAPGEIVRGEKSDLWVSTGDGVLAVHRLQPAGKRVMDVAEFLRGHPLEPGVVLGAK